MTAQYHRVAFRSAGALDRPLDPVDVRALRVEPFRRELGGSGLRIAAAGGSILGGPPGVAAVEEANRWMADAFENPNEESRVEVGLIAETVDDDRSIAVDAES